MRARSAFFAGAGSVAIVAIGWQSGLTQFVQAVQVNQSNQSTKASSSTSSNAPSSAPSSSSSASPSTSATAAPVPVVPTVADGIYDGAVINTLYGTVQVQAVMAGGHIADVIAVKLTEADRRSVAISTQVAPMVHDEVLAAQSAQVANITGGTYTTQGYLQSLQAALDAAGFTG